MESQSGHRHSTTNPHGRDFIGASKRCLVRLSRSVHREVASTSLHTSKPCIATPHKHTRQESSDTPPQKCSGEDNNRSCFIISLDQNSNQQKAKQTELTVKPYTDFSSHPTLLTSLNTIDHDDDGHDHDNVSHRTQRLHQRR